METLLEVRDLHVSIEGKEILKGVNLTIRRGEKHALMGPNGNGKSTLAAVIAGRDIFKVTQGEILYKGKNLLAMPVEDRAREGIFLGFQYPVEIKGVSMSNFMRTALNDIRKYRGLEPLGTGRCLVTVTEGKYHQVKRMLASRGTPVKALRRLSVGGLELDEGLGPGGLKELTEGDLCTLLNPGFMENLSKNP